MHAFRGQTVLITVLVLTIALTVALSLMRRSTTDVKTTQQLEESARAFSAAEAGIEDVLKRASGTTGTIQGANGPVSFETTYTTIGGSSAAYTYPTTTEMGEVATIWLVPHTANGLLDETGTEQYCQAAGACTIDICWEQQTGAKTAMEVVILLKNTTGLYTVRRKAFDPSTVTVRIGNNFTRLGASDGIQDACGRTGVYKRTITLPTDDGMMLALRIRPYYNKAQFSVTPTSSRTLPSQGFEVSSVGKVDSGVTRKITVKKQYDAPVSIFDYVLYSNSDILNEEYLPE